MLFVCFKSVFLHALLSCLVRVAGLGVIENCETFLTRMRKWVTFCLGWPRIVGWENYGIVAFCENSQVKWIGLYMVRAKGWPSYCVHCWESWLIGQSTAGGERGKGHKSYLYPTTQAPHDSYFKLDMDISGVEGASILWV